VTQSGNQGTAATDLTRKDYVDMQVATRLTQAVADGRYTQKSYVDAQVATRLTQAAADGRYVNTTGDTMTGVLKLSSGGVSSPAIQFTTDWTGGPAGQIFGNHNTPIGALECIMSVGGGASGAHGIFTFRNNGIGYSNGGWQQASDRRLKSDITKISNAMDKVNSISGYTFKRTDLGDRKTGGVIAQEVQAVLPESVSEMGGEDNYLAVDPMPLIGLLVEAVKELSAQVEALKAQPGA
jgi:hypothetical protein